MMADNSTPDLKRSESTATSVKGLEKENDHHAHIPESIPEEDERDNVGYAEYREGLRHSEITPAQNSTIRWKIDLVILPIFLITTTLHFLDRSALNYANLFGFQAGLNLKGKEFNWLGSMVYFGFSVTQYPAQWLIGKYPAQRVLAAAIFLWGFCVLCMAWCTSFRTALVSRFFLGIFEAFVSPSSLTIMTGWWYTRQELPLRQVIWFSGVGWGGVVGSYMSTGIASISDDYPGPAKWKYIFYILGSVTMAWSVVVFFLLPDSPASAKFLNAEQRLLAVQRVAGNQLGIKNKKVKRDQLVSAITDPKIVILFITNFASAVPNGIISNFSSVIIKDMGFSTIKTTVLKSVGDLVQIVSLFIGGIITFNVPNSRLLTATAANIISVVSAACMTYLPRDQVWQRLVSFWLVNTQSIGLSVALVMVSSNMGGYTHRAVASGVTVAGYCFGNIAGPFIVKQEEAPYYKSATAGLLAAYSVKLVSQMMLYVYMLWSNIRRERKYGAPDLDKSKEAGMQDKMEWENKDFRYVL